MHTDLLEHVTWHYFLLLSNTRTQHYSLHQRYTNSGPVPILALEESRIRILDSWSQLDSLKCRWKHVQDALRTQVRLHHSDRLRTRRPRSVLGHTVGHVFCLSSPSLSVTLHTSLLTLFKVWDNKQDVLHFILIIACSFCSHYSFVFCFSFK